MKQLLNEIEWYVESALREDKGQASVEALEAQLQRLGQALEQYVDDRIVVALRNNDGQSK